MFLHPEEEGRVPGVKPGDGVVLLHHLGEGLHVLVLDLLRQRLDQFGLSGVSKGWVLVLILGQGMGRVQTVWRTEERVVDTREDWSIYIYLHRGDTAGL